MAKAGRTHQAYIRRAYVETMKGLVTYGYTSELFLFDAAGQNKKLGEPTKRINGVQYVEAIKGLVTYGYTIEPFPFDAAGPGKKLNGPTDA